MKIGIVGAGNVGASVAHIALMKGLGDIYLLDIAADMAKGKAIDLNQSKYLFNSTATVDGGDDYSQIIDSDFIVVTAGLARKPGMSRDDLLFKNFEIVRDVCLKIKASKKQPFVIIVSNPLDVMAYTAYKTLGYPKNKVLGMAGVLDTYRFYHNIQKKLNTRSVKIDALTLGSHGDTMVPVSSEAKVDGRKLTALVPATELKELEDKTKNGGAEIVALLKTGSAYYAPAASTARMMEAIIKNQNAMLPCSVYADGEYGIKDIYVGLPVKLNKNGFAGAVNVKMNEDEKKQLAASAAAIKEQIDKIKDKF
jgi:malate dehydrogenase